MENGCPAEPEFCDPEPCDMATQALALDPQLFCSDASLEPVNYMGLCDGPDTRGNITLWIGERAVSFAPFCLTAGIVALYEEVSAIETDVAECQEPFAKLESVDDGCRGY